MPQQPRKLLLIACSSRKRRDQGLLPALERYDGVNYRVIKKLMREGRFPKNVDVLILSAKYGLIDAKTPIPYYDRRMERVRAAELRDQVSQHLERALRQYPYTEIFVNLGKVYLDALGESGQSILGRRGVRYAEGGIGRKMKEMRAWLLASNMM